VNYGSPHNRHSSPQLQRPVKIRHRDFSSHQTTTPVQNSAASSSHSTPFPRRETSSRPYQFTNPPSRHSASISDKPSPFGTNTCFGDEFGEEEEEDHKRLKIPKPQGEAGRPGRGGYTLRSKLNWSDTQFAQVKVRA
jgi:hypothetical protein